MYWEVEGWGAQRAKAHQEKLMVMVIPACHLSSECGFHSRP